MKGQFVFVILILINCLNVHAQAVTKFVSVYPVGDSLQFNVDADWSTMVPESLCNLEKEFDLEANRGLILNRRNMYGGSEFFYRHKLGDDLQRQTAYLATDSGVLPFEMIEFKGVMRIETDGNHVEDLVLTSVDHYGYVLGIAEEGLGKGGFVFFSTSNSDIKMTPSNLTTSELFNESVLSEGERFHWRIENQYIFEIKGESYIFVQWFGDEVCYEGCCQNRYTIFKNAVPYRSLVSTNFACDL